MLRRIIAQESGIVTCFLRISGFCFGNRPQQSSGRRFVCRQGDAPPDCVLFSLQFLPQEAKPFGLEMKYGEILLRSKCGLAVSVIIISLNMPDKGIAYPSGAGII